MSLATCYLIGGAPLSGKTTLASAWSARHRAHQISTDIIRMWLQQLMRPEDYKWLFTQIPDVEEFYRTYDTAQKVVHQQVEEAKDVEKGIEAFLGCGRFMERLVIEGTAITPAFALKLQKNFPAIAFEMTFLFDDNTDRITKRIHQRGLWGPKDSYPDYIKEKEVDWVVAYNDFYRAEAKKRNLPVLHIDDLQSESSI